MRVSDLLRVAGRLVRWPIRVSVPPAITLLQDAEFQLMLRELHYSPICHLAALSACRDRTRKSGANHVVEGAHEALGDPLPRGHHKGRAEGHGEPNR